MRAVLLYAVWFGLGTGLGAVLLLGLKKFILHQITLVTPDIIWISPLTFVIVGLFAGAVLAFLGKLLPRVFDIRTIVFLLAFCGSASGLLVWGKEFNDLSVLILAAGIGVQLGQLARSKPVFFQRVVRATLPVLVAVPVLGAIGVRVGYGVIERRAVSALPAARAGAPNVLLIVLDAVRYASTGMDPAGPPTTPHIQRFAETGITFDNAISPTSWTLASHASMFTGRPIRELSASWQHRLDETWPTLAEYLRQRGYRTGAVVGNFFYCNSEWGLDRGFLHFDDYDASLGHGLLGTFVGLKLVKKLESMGLDEHFWFHRVNGRRIAPQVRRDIARWIDRDHDRPWFAFVNFYDAHDPYVAPEQFIDSLPARPPWRRQPVRHLSGGKLADAGANEKEDALDALHDYEAGILYLDDQVGKLLDDLERRGRLDNTLVIITSDHGEEFGGHGQRWHGRTVYLPSIHVPLVVRLPDGARGGERRISPVSMTNLAATVVRALGLAEGAPFPGTSFVAGAPSAAEEPVVADVMLDERVTGRNGGFFRSIVDDEMHYILSDGGREELYRYRNDPLEQNDLASAEQGRLAVYAALVQAVEKEPRIPR